MEKSILFSIYLVSGQVKYLGAIRNENRKGQGSNTESFVLISHKVMQLDEPFVEYSHLPDKQEGLMIGEGGNFKGIE